MAERRDETLAKQFGQRLRLQRIEAGWTQEQLAEVVDMHPSFVAQVERGVSGPTLTTVVRLAYGLNIDPAVLVAGLQPSDLMTRQQTATPLRGRQ